MSTVSSAHNPRFAAVPISDTPSGPGNASGKSVRAVAVHGREGAGASVMARGFSRDGGHESAISLILSSRLRAGHASGMTAEVSGSGAGRLTPSVRQSRTPFPSRGRTYGGARLQVLALDGRGGPRQRRGGVGDGSVRQVSASLSSGWMSRENGAQGRDDKADVSHRSGNKAAAGPLIGVKPDPEMPT